MLSLLKKIEIHSQTKLYLVLVILGMSLAAQIQYIQHGWINPDSILYFESARLFALGDWQAAVKIFNWPLYSMLIAGTHKITSLDIHTSAQLLSVIFFGVTTASFLKIIALAEGSIKTMVAGALILFSSQYLVGSALEMLMRDQGFWAFYLTSLVFFIQFYKSKTYLNAFLWQTCAITATLFRIEAISFLIFLPMLLLFNQDEKWSQRIEDFIKCNFINIIIVICILFAIGMHGMTMSQFGRLREIFTTNLFMELTQKFFTQAEIMSSQVLGKYLEEFAVPGLILTFVYVMVSKTITATGLVNLGLAAFACKSKSYLMDLHAIQVLKAAAMIAIVNMILIITKVFVLSGRYVIALGLILMLLASFMLANLFKYLKANPATKDKKLKWLTIAILTFMLLGLFKNILPKAEGYNYLQDAAAWVKENNKENKPVFYNETRVRYYAGEPYAGNWTDNWELVKKNISNKTIYEYKYLVISHSKKHPEYEEYLAKKLPDFIEIKRFSPRKSNKSIVIYERRPLKKD